MSRNYTISQFPVGFECSLNAAAGLTIPAIVLGVIGEARRRCIDAITVRRGNGTVRYSTNRCDW